MRASQRAAARALPRPFWFRERLVRLSYSKDAELRSLKPVSIIFLGRKKEVHSGTHNEQSEIPFPFSRLSLLSREVLS
jgi:hypothetical protein